jgi:hypothetical protein
LRILSALPTAGPRVQTIFALLTLRAYARAAPIDESLSGSAQQILL